MHRLSALALTVVFLLAAVCAHATPAEITQMRVERSGEGVFLSAALVFDLPEVARDALHQGIPVHFVAQARLVRERWYWFDREIATVQRYIRLDYQPLTRRWRIVLSPTPFESSAPGLMGMTQEFEDLEAALESLKRVARWKICDAEKVSDDGRYELQFRFALDISRLPRPLQLSAGQSGWTLSLEHTLRLGQEVGP